MRTLSRSFKDAFSGLYYCFSTQRNMVLHVIAGLCAIAAALILQVDLEKLIILLGVAFLVIILETVNTAIEKSVDVATREYRRDAHLAKTVAAAAVLLSVFFAVITGILILGPPLFSLIFK